MTGVFEKGRPVRGKILHKVPGKLGEVAYEGDVNADFQMDGRGMVSWGGERNSEVKRHLTYEGTFRKGDMDGQGKLIWLNGDIFQGTMQANVPVEGECMWVWVCGFRCGVSPSLVGVALALPVLTA